MKVIAIEYFPTSIDIGKNEEKYEFHSYISDYNEQDARDSHAHMVHIFKTFLESVRLVSGISTVWEDTYGCAKQYRCALGVYLITVMSYSYVIIIDRAINAPAHVKNVFDGLDAT